MYKHGMVGTRLYNSWIGMKYRCLSPQHKDYKNYGARGISICKAWYDFEQFAMWALSNGYADYLTLDRIDTNGNYEPSNCRWINLTDQMNNKRNNIILQTSAGEMTLGRYCSAVGEKYNKIQMQYYRGKRYFTFPTEAAEAALRRAEG